MSITAVASADENLVQKYRHREMKIFDHHKEHKEKENQDAISVFEYVD